MKFDLASLFPEGDYRHVFRVERGVIGEFFGATPAHDAILLQRRHWLGSAPQTYAAFLPEAAPLLDEAIALAKEVRTLGAEEVQRLDQTADPRRRCLALGESWEPDYLLLKSDSAGELRLLAGCVCFPSSWSLSEKIGRPLDAIHAVVPGLNQQIGDRIRSFLLKLRPGIAWERTNWGLSGSPQLNQHPERNVPPPAPPLSLENVWLRIEHQALVALPKTEGILFGIRIAIHPLSQVKADPAAARGLARSLRTLPEEAARYKRLAAVREPLLALLENH